MWAGSGAVESHAAAIKNPHSPTVSLSMNRWKASATHLLLSLFLIGGIALAAFLLWYPWSLNRVSGVDRILWIMLGIDITAGPLLTLIVYKRGKRSLKFDLGTIAVLQLSFLGYGLHTLSEGRPVFLVGVDNQFTLVFANEIDQSDLDQAPRVEWRRLSWTGPQLVGTRMPTDASERREVMESFMQGGAGIERSPKYYMDFEQIAPELLASAAQPNNAGDAPANAAPWVPVVSRRGEGRMQLEAETGLPLRVLAP